MKCFRRFIMLIGFGLLLAASCWAATVTLTWDPMPSGQAWKTVRIYEIFGTSYQQIGEVPVGTTTISLSNVAAGPHKYAVRAYDGTWESQDSNAVSTPALPTSPQNLKYTITLTISN